MNWLLELIGGWLGAGWQRRFFRSKAERSEKPWRPNAQARREVLVPHGLAAAQELCNVVLASVGSGRQVQDDNAIEAVTPGNWRSAGTIVRVELQSVEDGTLVVVTAWPGAQLFDWGESRRIAKHVANRLVMGHS